MVVFVAVRHSAANLVFQPITAQCFMQLCCDLLVEHFETMSFWQTGAHTFKKEVLNLRL